MRKIIVALSFVLVFGGVAVAQTGGSSGSSSGQTAGTTSQSPVGHRQPRASDLPSEKNLSDPNDRLSKENQALDKKIKSICRGC